MHHGRFDNEIIHTIDEVNDSIVFNQHTQANGIDVREIQTNIFRTDERRLPLKTE